jgi:uroporphyrinogen decarboxylase
MMTSRDRFALTYRHEEADRIPMVDSLWDSTVERWTGEGLEGDYVKYFGLDLTAAFGPDISPRYPTGVVEETEDYRITTTEWGTTMKNWKHAASTPGFTKFTITDRRSWAEAKARMEPSDDRVPWEWLSGAYPEWRREGRWISVSFNFGYDWYASWVVGTARVLTATVRDPEWCRDMFETTLDLALDMLQRIWDRGYRFDEIGTCEDLGYRRGLFFSPAVYRGIIKPSHIRLCDFGRRLGVPVMLHSCGNINEIVPDLVDAGFSGLNPLESKSGMDVRELKREYGEQLVLQGGIDVRKMSKPDEIEAEIRDKVSVAKAGGGYIFSSDHSVPSDVSLRDYARVVELARKYGTYS